MIGLLVVVSEIRIIYKYYIYDTNLIRERLILTHGLQKRTTTQTSKPWKPRGDTLTCPLLSPFWFSGAVSYLYGKLDGNSTSLRNHEEDNKDTPSRQPRPPPEDRPISGTYPASQKTVISRTEAQKVAAATAEQEEAERRAAAHQRRAIPQVRYNTHRSSEHIHRTRANTQRQQHAAV